MESQGALQEFRSIARGKSHLKTSPTFLHHRQQGFTSIKETKNARQILDQHISTLHVGTKISLHGLRAQELNEKKGKVTGPAVNNRVGIQLEEGNQKVSVRIINIRCQEGPERNRQTFYSNLVDNAQVEITILKEGGHVSAFSYMERQTNNSGLMAKLYMERQAKSRERPCLGNKDKETKMHITQKLFVGFLQNLHQQTRRVFVHLFVYDVIVIRIPP